MVLFWKKKKVVVKQNAEYDFKSNNENDISCENPNGLGCGDYL